MNSVVLENHLTLPQVYSRSLTIALGCYTLARWVVRRYHQVTREPSKWRQTVVPVKVLTSFLLSLPIPSAKLLPSALTCTRWCRLSLPLPHDLFPPLFILIVSKCLTTCLHCSTVYQRYCPPLQRPCCMCPCAPPARRCRHLTLMYKVCLSPQPPLRSSPSSSPACCCLLTVTCAGVLFLPFCIYRYLLVVCCRCHR